MKFVTDPVSVLGAGLFGNVEESDLMDLWMEWNKSRKMYSPIRRKTVKE